MIPMKQIRVSDVLRKKLREFHSRVIMRDPFNHPSMITVMDCAAKLAPNNSKNEASIRKADRAAVARGWLGAPVAHEPGLADGKLNRNKILMGTPVSNVDGMALSEKDYALIRDAGFDFVICWGGGEFREKALDECLKNGIAVIAGNPGLPAVSESSRPWDFSGYQKHPAQVGDNGCDEPNTAQFALINEYEQAYRKALPGQFLFNNLFPDGTMKSLLGAGIYKEYVDRWADTVRSDYISVDHYPFYSTALINRFGFRLSLNTYDCIGDACRRTGRDFWIYTQTQGNWFAHLYLRVTFEQVKWQVYTALCYGARSIIQVAYTPVWGDDAYGMIDRDGNLTEQYLYAKRINAEVQKLSPVLTPYRSLGVLCADAAKENPDFSPAVRQQRKSSAAHGFSGISEVRRVRSESTALVGFFENAKGGRALMLVNCRDLFDAQASQSVVVDLNGSYRVRVYQKGELTLDAVQSIVRIRLCSCEGAFITLTRTNDKKTRPFPCFMEK